MSAQPYQRIVTDDEGYVQEHDGRHGGAHTAATSGNHVHGTAAASYARQPVPPVPQSQVQGQVEHFPLHHHHHQRQQQQQPYAAHYAHPHPHHPSQPSPPPLPPHRYQQQRYPQAGPSTGYTGGGGAEVSWNTTTTNSPLASPTSSTASPTLSISGLVASGGSGSGSGSASASGADSSKGKGKQKAEDEPPEGVSKRTMQNRKAQRDFRARRATYIKDLEEKVRRHEIDYSRDRTLAANEQRELEHLRRQNSLLEAENERLRRHIGHPVPSGSGSMNGTSEMTHPMQQQRPSTSASTHMSQQQNPPSTSTMHSSILGLTADYSPHPHSQTHSTMGGYVASPTPLQLPSSYPSPDGGMNGRTTDGVRRVSGTAPLMGMGINSPYGDGNGRPYTGSGSGGSGESGGSRSGSSGNASAEDVSRSGSSAGVSVSVAGGLGVGVNENGRPPPVPVGREQDQWTAIAQHQHHQRINGGAAAQGGGQGQQAG